MIKDDPNNVGLFSKVVKFVRNPGTNWSDLDGKESDRESAYSKQALKEMIERKRRNDFVRKREFDMLRKLRRREASGLPPGLSEGSARPSFFQSSMPSKPDDRAQTLKKIDEIEAQMSMQWWKTKHGASSAMSKGSAVSQSSEFPGEDVANSNKATDYTNGSMARPANADMRSTTPSVRGRAYDPTVADDLDNPIARANGEPLRPPLQAPAVARAAMPPPPMQAAPAPVAMRPPPMEMQTPAMRPTPAATQAPAAMQAPARPVVPVAPVVPAPAASPVAQKSKNPIMGNLAASYDGGANTGFSTSKLFALDVTEVQHDPELEEAAIRFANGDDAGAEAGLLEALSPTGGRANHDETWFTVFDLYRATGQQDRFESLAIDFAGKFNRSAPMWFSIPEMVGKLTNSAAVPADGARKADWRCPAVVGTQTVAALSAALAKASMPWCLDWTNLKTIEEQALPLMIKLFAGWAAELVKLRFISANVLDKVLLQATPSGVRETSHDWWKLRLQMQRITHRPDEFELTALDFCVTYELSPPAWESARCDFKALDSDGASGVSHTIIGEARYDSVTSGMGSFGDSSLGAPSSQIRQQLASVELSGQIQGDPVAVLNKLEARLAGADLMHISCAKLIRVDFSAAGTLLNWVSARQSEGRMVQFSDVNRMVAAFFHVIGISDHAKVITRVD